MTQTFILGLDGASWKLLEPWIKEGQLPNIEALREQGSWATNRSCLPPVTFPNWKCYSSGKNPGKFGVYWFERIDIENERIEIPNRTDFKTTELWDYLNDAGLSAGVVNMPTMFPPREIDGCIVCGGPDAVDGEYRSIEGGYTYPTAIEEELKNRFAYRVHPEPLLSSNAERGAEVEEILELLDKRLEVATTLAEEQNLDVIHVTLFYLNVLQHFFWNDKPTQRAWELIDEWVGKMSEYEDTNLVLMSDHGCGPTHTEFYINEWLSENGYLTEQRTIEDYLTAVGLTRENALNMAKQLGIVGLLEQLVPEKIQQLVPQSAGAKRGRKLDKVVLNETKAVASGQGPVYLNPSFDVDTVANSLIDELQKITDSTGQPLFEAVHRASDVYNGPFIRRGPEIVIEQAPGVHINDGLGGGKIMTDPDRWAAENTRSGIFVASGPDFDPQGHFAEISIIDIMPTILASQNVPIPTDIDGEILPIADQSVGTQSPIEFEDASQTDHGTGVTDRLKQLGYME